MGGPGRERGGGGGAERLYACRPTTMNVEAEMRMFGLGKGATLLLSCHIPFQSLFVRIDTCFDLTSSLRHQADLTVATFFTTGAHFLAHPYCPGPTQGLF